MSLLMAAGVDADLVDASCSDVAPEQALNGCDILVVLGGADVDPKHYGQETMTSTLYGINAKADRFEIKLIQEALRTDKSVLGICRGMQLLNVACGGTLVQDLGFEGIHNLAPPNFTFSGHDVHISPGSHLASIFDTATISIRSSHHQAVQRLGTDLRVSAIADDGVVEAIELNTPNWVIGVQWHPEEEDADRDQAMRFFRAIARRSGT